MQDTIRCGNCGKDSGVERQASDGINAAAIQSVGWIPKLPILVGIPEWLFACSPECKTELLKKKYAEHQVTDEQIKEADKIIDDFKKKIPAMAQETCEFMGKVQKVLRRKKS